MCSDLADIERHASPSIVLTMIVKNEAHVIERCLASVRPLLSHWIVVDTGSTDGTQDVVRRALAGLPGEVHERPWRGFGESRTEAMELARGHGTHALVIDADDELEIPADFELPLLDRDAYELEIRQGTARYWRLHLFRLAKPWRYVGVLHEVAVIGEPSSCARLDGITYRCRGGGARSKDPDKYRHDAETLERAMVAEPDNERYVFYAAQSWRDAGDDRRAMALYRQRSLLAGFDEEIYVARLELGRAAERLGEPPEVVLGAYLAAHQARPTRAEALYELARFCRSRGEYALAWLFADAAVKIPFPVGDRLFLPDDVYAWRVHDEHAIAAHWTGRYELARELNERLLVDPRVPEAEHDRIRANLGWANSALGERG